MKNKGFRAAVLPEQGLENGVHSWGGADGLENLLHRAVIGRYEIAPSVNKANLEKNLKD